MTKYLYLYSAGRRGSKERMARGWLPLWMTYFGELGPALVDQGASLVPISHLLGGAKACEATGFSIIQARTLEEAVALTAGHPHLRHGGAIEVMEYMPAPLMATNACVQLAATEAWHSSSSEA
jgi:hypothetical protein